MYASDDPSVVLASCSACGTSVCKHCELRVANGEPHDCKQPAHGRRENFYNRVWMVTHTKRCPNCHVQIEKNSGCEHMTCRNCGYYFCWVCKKHLDDDESYCWCSGGTFAAFLLAGVVSIPVVIPVLGIYLIYKVGRKASRGTRQVILYRKKSSQGDEPCPPVYFRNQWIHGNYAQELCGPEVDFDLR